MATVVEADAYFKEGIRHKEHRETEKILSVRNVQIVFHIIQLTDLRQSFGIGRITCQLTRAFPIPDLSRKQRRYITDSHGIKRRSIRRKSRFSSTVMTSSSVVFVPSLLQGDSAFSSSILTPSLSESTGILTASMMDFDRLEASGRCASNELRDKYGILSLCIFTQSQIERGKSFFSAAQ